MRDLEFSVIIPTRDRSEDLRHCLRALYDQDHPRDRFEVVVCDDGSEEALQPVVDEFTGIGLDVKYVRQEQRGPAAARNLGIRKSTGKIVAMTDSDTIPDKAWLRKLGEAFISYPNAAGVEGKVFAVNEGEFDPLGEGPINKDGGVYLTCNCAYRRDVLIEVGGFDETFPYAAYEDTELAARVSKIGSIIWHPEAVVMHPQRPLTLKSVIKKLRHWEYVLLMGYRYGYLAWKIYPVKYPGLRVVVLSVIALPLAKFRTAMKWIFRRPSAALKLAFFGIVESVGAMILVVPMVLSGEGRTKTERRDFLKLHEAAR